MKELSILLFLFLSFKGFTQQLTGEELLDKAIKFHDPNNNWATFKGTLWVTMKTPKDTPRESKITIDLTNEYFSVDAKKDVNTTTYTVDKGIHSYALNGDKNPSEKDIEKFKLSKKRAALYQNYYTYLYGLPMKLKDKGTIVHEKVERKRFKGKIYLRLKVTYPAEIGKDTWYFYFDPTTYAMEVYQFFKDESKNDGEYILLSKLEIINNIKMPKIRAWYYNKNDGYLGTDILASTKN